MDCHCHHFRVTRQYSSVYLLVRNGGGDTRIRLTGGNKTLLDPLESLDTNSRYWLLFAIYDVHQSAGREASEKANATWMKAATEKRIKTRKQTARGTVKVWIEPAVVGVA
jgi:hypothetical protein